MSETEHTPPLLRSFEVSRNGTVLAYGDESGVHYADGEDAASIVALMHEWGWREANRASLDVLDMDRLTGLAMQLND
jgi:hypothetical protein